MNKIELTKNMEKHSIKNKLFNLDYPLTKTSIIFPPLAYSGQDEKSLLGFAGFCLVNIGICYTIDRFVINKDKKIKAKTIEDTLTKNNNVEKILGPDISFLTNQIRRDRGIKNSNFNIAYEKRNITKGSSLRQSGYISEIGITFDNDETAELIHKFTLKDNRTGDKISNKLSEKYSFVPRTFLMDSKPMDRKFVGSFYEFCDGRQMSEMMDSDEHKINYDMIKKNFKKIDLDNIFSNLSKIYSDTEVKQKNMEVNKLHTKNLERMIQGFGINRENDFAKEYQTLIDNNTENLTLIHGDLHQDNILFNKNGSNFIDWDNTNIASPYQDFFHLAAISDYTYHEDFEKTKEKFLDDIATKIGTISKEQQKFEEFGVYLNFLSRYHQGTEEVPEVFRENYRDISTTLLDKTLQTLKEYSEISKNDKLYDTFKELTDKSFSDLKNREIKETSTAYAHRVTQDYGTIDEMRLNHHTIAHQSITINSLLKHKESQSYMKVSLANLFTLSSICIGVGLAYPEDKELSSKMLNYGSAGFGIGVLTCLKEYKNNIGRVIDNAKTYFATKRK